MAVSPATRLRALLGGPEFRQEVTPRRASDTLLSFAQFNAFVGLPALRELERQFVELP